MKRRSSSALPCATLLAPAAALLLAACAAGPEPDDALRARAERLAHEVVILDGHIDVPYRLRQRWEDVTRRTEGGDFDLVRARAGGLDAPFMSIYVPAAAEDDGTAKAVADELIDLVEDIAARAPEACMLATSAADVRRAFAEGKIALLMGMENGAPIEGDLANLEHFQRRGVRYITLCHSKDNHICDSSYDERHTSGGLTPFGRELVLRMNDLGVMVDVSHVSDDAFMQVLELSRAPVIASHSSLRHFTPGFERNVSDDMLRALAARGGVLQVNFGSGFLEDRYRRAETARREAFAELAEREGLEPRSDAWRAAREAFHAERPLPVLDVRHVADHIERAVAIAGIEHVGLGSDFDGVGDSLPEGLKDVSMYPNLFAELLRRGFSERDVALVAGENVLRVMAEVERIAANARAAGAGATAGS